MSNCNCHTEIVRDGSGQLSRYLKALDPTYVHIDDRSIADLLVFAKRYAAQIRFYDIPGSVIDPYEDETKVSWREFFRRDMAVVIASVGLVDVKQIKANYDELRTRLDQQPDHSLFAELFSPIIGMAARIDKWYALAIPNNPLHTDLDLAIASNLKQQLTKIREYESGFLSVDAYHPLKLDYSAIQNQDLWGLDDHSGTDATIYQGATMEDRIRYGALFVDDIFHAFYGFIVHLIDISDSYLKYALEQYPAHQPHMALFIAFLRLFKLAQDQMNGLTERMLNFYYRDVLHLSEKPSVPDRAYIVFELAKDVLAYDVIKGTSLKAGKDSIGKEQIYKTTSELVVNEAKVKELKTIFVDKTAAVNSVISAVYARPIAKSADGFGEKFTDPVGKWPTFGRGTPRPGAVKNICQAIDQYTELANRKDQAQLGFAIASPQLLLQAGNRMIKCRLDGFGEFIDGKNASIWLTTEEGWVEVNLENARLPNVIDGGKFHVTDIIERSYFFDKDNDTLFVFLPVAEKGVIPFDEKVHKEFYFPTPYPVMQILIGPGIGMDHEKFNKLKCDTIRMEIFVGSINPFEESNEGNNSFLKMTPNMDGLTTLLIKNDDGIVPAGTPFDPFTAFPQNGNSFYIGSDEVFNKPILELSVNLELVSSIASKNRMVPFLTSIARKFGDFLGVSVLTKGHWTPLFRKSDGQENFTIGELTQTVLLEENEKLLHDRMPILYNEDVTNSSFKGFINIKNLLPVSEGNNDRNLFEFMQELAKLLKVRRVSLSYHSVLARLDTTVDQVFHVYPFGVVETYFGTQTNSLSLGQVKKSIRRVAPRRATPFISKPEFQELDKEKDFLLVDAKQKLLPQFTYTSPYSKFEPGSVKVGDYKVLLNGANIDWDAEIVPKMIEASGLKEKAEGDINQYSGNLQEEGLLFIGIEKLKPLQSISLLFQFAEGSAEDEDADPPPIHWSYLMNNEWRPLKDEHIITDGTDGFRATGIIKFDVPGDATLNNTLLPGGLIWFCASVTKDSNRIPMLIDVVAQAVEAQFEDKGNAQSHFDMALPAGKISKLEVNVAEIAKINQPFASFDGKHREIGKEFFTRVSERLRHKGRAITAWDYEHLILDRFPSIYKVKAVTHTDPNCFCRGPVAYKEAEEQKEMVECTIGKLSIELRPQDIQPTAASMALLKATALQMKENPDCQLLIVGSFTEDNEESRKLAQNRLEFILKSLEINRDRFEEKIVPEGDDNLFTLEGITRKESKPEHLEAPCCGPQVAPGHVLIIPIADLKNRNAVNPLQPKTSRRTLVDIEKYISTRTSPFVKVHVRNPLYEQVLVYFKVKFYPGVDKGFHLKKLNDEIVRYLTPWAFDANAEVKFGQKIYASSIINFIEEREYVDFIVDFQMFVCRDECCPPTRAQKAEEQSEGLSAMVDIKVHVVAGAPVQISGKVTNLRSGTGIAGVKVEERGVVNEVTTDEKGDFLIVVKGSTMEYLFQVKGYEPERVKADGDKSVSVTFKKQGSEVVVVGYNQSGMSSANLERGCGCSGIENMLDNAPNFIGETVVSPSTPRSILVSVPQHIIIPFEEVPRPSPCEERKAKKEKIALDELATNNPVAIKDVAPRTKKGIKKSKTRKHG